MDRSQVVGDDRACASGGATSPEFVAQAIAHHCRTGHLYLHVEPTNSCNIECAMCPRSAMSRAVSTMRPHVFDSVLRLLRSSTIPMVSLVGFGEPLLHRRFASMVADLRAAKPSLFLKATTNGSLLTPKMSDEIFAAGLDLLEISVVGIDPLTYSTMMGGLELGSTLSTIARLRDEGRPFLITTFETDGVSRTMIRSFWSERGIDNVEVKALHRRGGYLRSEAVPVRMTSGEYTSRAGRSPSAPLAPDDCHKLYLFMHVNAEGGVVPCVQEINSKNVLFHIADVASYDDALQRLRRFRPEFDICQGCELREQDQIEYYSRFLVKHAPAVAARLCASMSSVT